MHSRGCGSWVRSNGFPQAVTPVLCLRGNGATRSFRLIYAEAAIRADPHQLLLLSLLHIYLCCALTQRVVLKLEFDLDYPIFGDCGRSARARHRRRAGGRAEMPDGVSSFGAI